MTFSHEDANARLLDLVYGEGAPAEREALQAHVATCARCQEELAALGDTRARLRVALDDEAPPARAHARILAAAAAEASNGAQAGAAATAPPAKGNEPASRAGRTEDQPSFWDWLRGKWTFPTLATVGAVAVMLLGAKVFLDPQKTLERGKQGIFPKEEAAPAAGTDKGMVEPLAKMEPPPADMPAPAGEAKAARDRSAEQERQLSPQARARIQAVRRYNMPRTTVDGLMGSQPSFKNDKLGGAPASQAIGGLRPDSFGAGGGARGAVSGNAAATPPPPAEKKPAKGSVDDLLEGSDSSGQRYAPPPSGWKSSRPAAPAAAAPPPPPKPALAKKRADSEDNPLQGFGGGSSSAHARAAPERDEAASSNVEAEEAAPRHKSAPAEARAEPVAPAAAPVARSEAAKVAAPPADAKKEKAAKEKDAAPSYEALAKRADELYAAQRWPEAIAAYNDLLRRFPTAEPAPRWRSRLGLAQREAAPKTAPAAKAASKKTTSDSALDGL